MNGKCGKWFSPEKKCSMADEILKGAFSAEEVADEIEDMRESGLPRGQSIGWWALDPFYTVPKGQWTVVTGFSGSGKSTWLDNVFVQLAQNAGWKILICSPENQPIKRHVASLMEIYAGKKFGRPNPKFPTVPKRAYMSDEEHKAAYAFVCEHFYFINPPDTDFTVDGIIAIAAEVYENHFQFDGMVLDPYNEIEHKAPSGMSETSYISTVIQKYRSFTRQLNIHFWFVAHPTKPTRVPVKYQAQDLDDVAKKPVYQRATLFDISGSAHWKNKCDFGIIVHRDMNDASAPSIIEIEKIRFRENGNWGEVPMYYDFLCNRFVEHYDQLLYGKVRDYE